MVFVELLCGVGGMEHVGSEAADHLWVNTITITSQARVSKSDIPATMSITISSPGPCTAPSPAVSPASTGPSALYTSSTDSRCMTAHEIDTQTTAALQMPMAPASSSFARNDAVASPALVPSRTTIGGRLNAWGCPRCSPRPRTAGALVRVLAAGLAEPTLYRSARPAAGGGFVRSQQSEVLSHGSSSRHTSIISTRRSIESTRHGGCCELTIGGWEPRFMDRYAGSRATVVSPMPYCIVHL